MLLLDECYKQIQLNRCCGEIVIHNGYVLDKVGVWNKENGQQRVNENTVRRSQDFSLGWGHPADTTQPLRQSCTRLKLSREAGDL